MKTIVELNTALEPVPFSGHDEGLHDVHRRIDPTRYRELDPRWQICMMAGGPGTVYHSGLFNYLALCWRHHYAAVLTPDMIWNAILAEMAGAIKKEPDTWAHLFTTEPGKKQHIVVMTGKVEEIDPRAVVALLENKVPTDTKTFLPKFSTTTDASHLANCIAFCDIVSPYYSYGTMLCGIPYIDIRGGIEDWSLIAFNLDAMTRLSVTRPMTEFLRRCQGIVARVMDTVEGKKCEDWHQMVSIKPCGSGSQYEMSGWITSLIYAASKRPTQLEGLPPQMCSMEYINHDTNRRFKLFGGLIQSRIVGQALEPDFGFARIELRDRPPVYTEKSDYSEMTLKSQPITPTRQRLEKQWTAQETPVKAMHSPEVEDLLKKTLK